MNHPSQLVSLLDMLRVYAQKYIELGRWMHELGGRLYMAEDEPDDPGRPLSPEDKSALLVHIDKLAQLSARLGLKVSQQQWERALKDPPQTSREFEILQNVLESELRNQLFLFVPSERALYFEAQTSFPSFPSATKELVRAGNCFAVAEFAASVFHSMRAVEIALTAVYACMGLVQPATGNKSWGTYCNGIRDAMTSKGKTWPKLDEFQEILTTLVNVKDGWRNKSMHVDASYSEEDAKRILQAVTFFIEKVSSKMDEQGNPRA